MGVLPPASKLMKTILMKELQVPSRYIINATMSSIPPIPSTIPSYDDITPPSNTSANPPGTTDLQVPSHHWVFLILLLVIFISVIGNVLVCLAIVTEKRLHSATNYFLLSMAVADLMVAVLVMPMGLVKYLLGVWLLGPTMCNIWVSLDILCCTSSILHICTISLDRYLAICSPFATQRRSRFQTPTKIFIVWMISIILCSPIFVLGFVSRAEVLDVKVCTLTNRLFMIYGSIVAFYIPFLIVVVTYGRTAYALNKKARTFAVPKTTKNLSTNSTQDEVVGKQHALYKAMSCCHQCTDTNGNTFNDSVSSDTYTKLPDEETSVNKKIQTLKAETLTLNGSPRISPTTNHLKEPVEMRRSTSGSMRKGYSSKINTERRASKVLGLVFAAFVIGWTPFFFTNFLFAVCTSCEINLTLFSIFEWLGWASSMVNPFIYTIFNKTFQKTFWKLLRCKWHPRKRSCHSCLKRPATLIENKPAISLKNNSS